MVSSISSSTLAVPTSTEKIKDDPVAVREVKTADEALNMLLQDPALLQSLTEQSSIYVPISKSKILATLWGLLNTSGVSGLGKTDVKLAIYAEGGGTSSGDALWAQMNPKDKDVMDAWDFAVDKYLNAAITANLSSVQEAVEEARRESASTARSSGSVLDLFAGGGASGTVLDLFV